MIFDEPSYWQESAHFCPGDAWPGSALSRAGHRARELFVMGLVDNFAQRVNLMGTAKLMDFPLVLIEIY